MEVNHEVIETISNTKIGAAFGLVKPKKLEHNTEVHFQTVYE